MDPDKWPKWLKVATSPAVGYVMEAGLMVVFLATALTTTSEVLRVITWGGVVMVTASAVLGVIGQRRLKRRHAATTDPDADA